MQRHVFFLRRVVLWLRRLPYRQGYGIHSPWAFSFVKSVIYEEEEYYAYEPLRSQCSYVTTCEKDDRLLLRLANAFQPSRAILWGSDAVSEPLRYMIAGRQACEYRHVERGDMDGLHHALEEWGGIDFLYVDDEVAWRSVVEAALDYAHTRTCIIIRSVGGKACEEWHDLIADKRIRLSFDLYYWGILCFDTRFAKQDYVINYT